MKVTFHDPCYLGRHNKIFDAPREDLKSAGVEVVEMPRNSAKSFCLRRRRRASVEGRRSRLGARQYDALCRGKNPLVQRRLRLVVHSVWELMTDASKADGGTIQVKRYRGNRRRKNEIIFYSNEKAGYK